MSLVEDRISEKEVNKLSDVKFDATFTQDNGDDSPPDVDSMISGFEDETGAKNSQGQVVDYTSAMMGFWSFIDLIMTGVAKSTKGTIEYEKMDQGTLRSLAMQSAGSPHFQKLAVMENAPTWLVVANAVGQFGTRIKYNPKEKEEEKSKKSEYSDEDKLMLRKLLQKEKPVATPSPAPQSKEYTQGDLAKMLDSEDLSEQDKRDLKSLVETGDLSPQTYTQKRAFGKSRSQEIAKEEKKRDMRAKNQ